MRPRAINSCRRVIDVELNVVVLGEGRNEVLLVHGFPDDHTVWRNQIRRSSTPATV